MSEHNISFDDPLELIDAMLMVFGEAAAKGEGLVFQHEAVAIFANALPCMRIAVLGLETAKKERDELLALARQSDPVEAAKAGASAAVVDLTEALERERAQKRQSSRYAAMNIPGTNVTIFPVVARPTFAEGGAA